MSSNYKSFTKRGGRYSPDLQTGAPIFTKRTSVFRVGRLDSERDRKLAVFDWEPWAISKKEFWRKRVDVGYLACLLLDVVLC
ncbi:hypothetical protein CEXT_552631 [Caerostris extrusa]|uniref:Uncharacterized protein n=1 Tax=Caerostris extrusa TaxID=172846 RepID=A0AAV4UX66_CAEEX|nr:hypothetical protein CEXT_552631 [Caerostris extrusa]